jgi:hypothetical protein
LRIIQLLLSCVLNWIKKEGGTVLTALRAFHNNYFTDTLVFVGGPSRLTVSTLYDLMCGAVYHVYYRQPITNLWFEYVPGYVEDYD